MNSTIQTVRRISQVLAAIFFTGLFSLALSGLQKVYTQIIHGGFRFSDMQIFIIPLLAVAGLTLLFGRFFCGWFCAFGALNDFLYGIAKRFFPKIHLTVQQPLHTRLVVTKYFLLGTLIAFAWTIPLLPVDQWSAWTAFTQILGGSFSPTLGFGLLILILAGSFLAERFFCRYLCPLGAFLAIIAKLGATAIHKPDGSCHSCKACSHACPMGINLHATGPVSPSECIRCLKCMEICPHNNIRVNFFMKSFNTVTYVITAILLFYVINLSGRFSVSGRAMAVQKNFAETVAKNQAQQKPQATAAAKATPDRPDQIYHDGVYQGEATGFRPGLQVSVTIQNDRIMAVKILASHESPGFREVPFQTIPEAIVRSQSTNVDAVSGATFTSKGIMNAVNNALNKARIQKGPVSS